MNYKEKVLDNIYTVNAKDSDAAVDYLMGDFPIIEKNLELVDEILNELDLTRLNSQMLYQLVAQVSAYINVLKNYRSFYDRTIKECASRGYSDKRIKGLFESYKDGGNHIYDPDYKPRRYDEKIYLEKLEQKIAWAKEIGDDVLENLLSSHKSNLMIKDRLRNKYHTELYTFGSQEYSKRVANALRVMADKVEEPGSHFIIDAEVPRLPIFNKDYDDFETATVSVTLAPYPTGG